MPGFAFFRVYFRLILMSDLWERLLPVGTGDVPLLFGEFDSVRVWRGDFWDRIWLKKGRIVYDLG